jgi:hypothetical protein
MDGVSCPDRSFYIGCSLAMLFSVLYVLHVVYYSVFLSLFTIYGCCGLSRLYFIILIADSYNGYCVLF